MIYVEKCKPIELTIQWQTQIVFWLAWNVSGASKLIQAVPSSFGSLYLS